MAKNPKISALEDEAQLVRNLSKEYADIFKMKSDDVLNGLKNIDIEKDLLKAQRSLGLILADEFKLKNAALAMDKNIYNMSLIKEKVTGRSLKDYIRTHKAVMDITDAQKKSGEMILLGIFGLTRFVEKIQEMKKHWTETKHLIAASIGAFIWYEIFRAFKNIDDAAAKFRMEMGVTRTFTQRIYDLARDLTMELRNVGVTAEIANNAIFELSKHLFSSLSVTKGLAENVALMKSQLGVSEEISSDFLKNLGIINKTTANAQINMSYYAAALSEAAGTQLSVIMSDVNNATKSSYQFISKSGLALIKAAVEARRMGTSLESATKTSSNLLNFTESVKAEMEASVLVGQSINLQTARELSYRRDIKGLNNEILKIIKQTNFENLDPFQQNAVAEALGKSAGELADMAQAERQRLGWESSTDEKIKSQLKSYKELMASTEAIAVANGKDLAIQLRIKANQAELTRLSQTWASITQQLSEKFLPRIVDVLEFVNTLLSNSIIGGWIKWIGLIGGATFGAYSLYKVFNAIRNIIFGPLGGASTLGGALKKGAGGKGIFGGIAEGLKSFSEVSWSSILKGAAVLFALGAAMIPFAFSMKLMEGIDWKVIVASSVAILALAGAAFILSDLLPEILIGAIAIAALGAALRPASVAFKESGEAFKLLGDGLQESVNALISLQQLSFVGTIKEIFQLKDAVSELSKALSGIPIIDITPLSNLSNMSLPTTNVTATNVEKQKDTMTNSDVVDAINKGFGELISDLKNGVITANVYLDSQKLDSGMGRRLNFTGTLT